MITIDGSFGEGGGQILRSSLALSLVTGKPFCIQNIRARRSRPGLMRQHLTAVCAAMDVGQAEVKGADVGSTFIEFVPRTVRAGDFHFAVGTAGSATLVLQTILPALLVADQPSRLVLEGGTHNPYAPPFDFLSEAFLPVIETMGPKVRAELERPGFYPAGGGRFTVQITPVPRLQGIERTQRGELCHCGARALVARLPASIGERELTTLRRELPLADEGWRVEEVTNSLGPGNALMVKVVHQEATEVFVGFGERRVSAETVAQRAAKQVKRYVAAEVPVGPYLADQLIVPLALAGQGKFRTVNLSRHTKTNLAVVQQFLDVEFTQEEIGNDAVEIGIRST
jgi:RNA 3'-terminal phosphate cyclase (ATP)